MKSHEMMATSTK